MSSLILMFAALMLLPVIGCTQTGAKPSGCLACHTGIEHVSPNHSGCVECHGGNRLEADKDKAHRGMFGGKNPSAPDSWEQSCGACHAYQLARVRSSLMYTNTGIIKSIQETWEGNDPRLFATRSEEVFGADGKPLQLQGVADLDNLSGELYRKFCSLCHIGLETNQVYAASHGAGCAACHFPYNDIATYEGQDPTIKGQWPYSESHAMTALPDNQVCGRCHNRSGRIALSYEGKHDGNNGLVPTSDGLPGPEMISGMRNATSISPDIHFERGLDCIDCHTSRDIMGDGYAYENMFDQIEISCEDCHGSADEPPRYQAIERENDEALRESKNYPRPMQQGQEMVLTAKGRKYSNVFWEDGKVWLLSKRSGKLHESKVITGTPEHRIAGHQRMECYSCHSRTVVQCYGCHTEYDQSQMGMDFIKGKETPGRFSETEDYRKLYPFPLALNQRGRVSPVTPGCQTFISVTDGDGNKVRDGYVAKYKGSSQLRFAPFYGHNTGTRAVGCRECHGNPAFLGFGQHVVEGSSIEGTLLCEKSQTKPLDGFLSMDFGRVRAYSAITRENSRPLSGAEVKRVLAVNQCLVCHDDPRDPIYQKELDYLELDNCLNRTLPAAP